MSEGADRIKPTMLQLGCLFRDIQIAATVWNGAGYPDMPRKSILTIDNVQLFAIKIPVSLQFRYIFFALGNRYVRDWEAGSAEDCGRASWLVTGWG